MARLSDNFSRAEFACKCGCGQDTVDAQLLDILQDIRNEFGPVTITSANRCPSHNKAEGGSEKSQHLRGRAADIQLTGIPPSQIAIYVDDKWPNTGLGAYNTFTHIDTRGHKARW